MTRAVYVPIPGIDKSVSVITGSISGPLNGHWKRQRNVVPAILHACSKKPRFARKLRNALDDILLFAVNFVVVRVERPTNVAPFIIS